MNRNSPLRVLVADPQPIVCDGIAAILARQPDMCVVGQAGRGSEAIGLFCKLQPDVLVMEHFFPDLDGRTVISTLKAKFPAARILVLSLYEEEERVYTALQAGAKGYFPKDVTAETLVEGVRSVSAGNTAIPHAIARKIADRITRPELTRRERELLQLIVAGKTNQEIAAALSIMEGTVKSHLNSIMAKLEVISRTQAALVAIQRGLAEVR